MTSDSPAPSRAQGARSSPGEEETAGIRIASAGGKVAFFAAGYFVVFCVGILCWDLFHFTVGSVIYLVLFLGWAGIASRSFRGKGEPRPAPRPWWKLTASPTTGWILAGLLLLQVEVLVESSLGGFGGKTKLMIAATYLFVAALLIHSSIRLLSAKRASHHETPSPRPRQRSRDH